MADGVDFKLEGLEELLGKLESVTEDIKFKGGRSSLRKAANLVVKAAKENASKLNNPSSAESISQNIAARWSNRRYKRTGDLMFRIGVLGGATSNKDGGTPGLKGGDTRHWRQQEFGNSIHAPQPFLRRAMSENIQAITNEFVSRYPAAIDAAIRRAKKKAAK